MSKWIFRKPESPLIRALCVLCKKNLQKRSWSDSKRRGVDVYTSLCTPCERKRYSMVDKHRGYVLKRRRPYSIYKKDICESCGFIAKHDCQMDIHHIDGNHKNNDPNNLKTLCANCHRLEHTKRPPMLSTASGVFSRLNFKSGVISPIYQFH